VVQLKPLYKLTIFILALPQIKYNMVKLVSLLDKYNLADEDDLSLIETEIWQKFEATTTVFVLDMSGFTQTVQEKGIIHYLSMVRKMQLAVQPIIEKYKGTIIKFEADNVYATFESVKKAVEASIAINLAINAMNILTDEDKDIAVGIGIGYGKILLIKGEDFFGDAVNKASKLGEDFANAGDILLSVDAYEALTNKEDYTFEEKVFNISALMIKGFRVIL
jgi:adenylate cyclase